MGLTQSRNESHSRIPVDTDVDTDAEYDEDGVGPLPEISEIPQALRFSRTRTTRGLRLNKLAEDISYTLTDGTEYRPSDTRKSIIARAFAPISIKGAIFNLLAAALGSGILSYPFAFRASGILWGSFLLAVCTCFAYISLNLLIIASDNMPDPNVQPSYLSLAFASGGQKLMIFTQIIISLQLCGSAISRCFCIIHVCFCV